MELSQDKELKKGHHLIQVKHFAIMDIMVGFVIKNQLIFKLIKKKEMDSKLEKL